MTSSGAHGPDGRPTSSRSHSGSSKAAAANGQFPVGATDSLSVSTDNLLPGQTQLMPAGMAILNSLYLVRLATTSQLQRLHFADGTARHRLRRTQAALRRLIDDGFVVALERRIGKTRRANLFTLTGRGMAALGMRGPYGRRRRIPAHGKPFFQDHMLAVAEAYTSLVERCRASDVELLGFDTEPTCWRRYPGTGGEAQILKPDGVARVGTREHELVSFVEVDLGTESLPTVQRKCGIYLRYYRTGLEQQARGVFPRVVWLVRDQRRVENIGRLLTTLRDEATSRLFTVALHEHGPDILTTLPNDGARS